MLTKIVHKTLDVLLNTKAGQKYCRDNFSNKILLKRTNPEEFIENIAELAESMNWKLCFRMSPDSEDSEVQGLIVGTDDYVDYMVDLQENVTLYTEPKPWQ